MNIYPTIHRYHVKTFHSIVIAINCQLSEWTYHIPHKKKNFPIQLLMPKIVKMSKSSLFRDKKTFFIHSERRLMQ